MQDTAFPDLEFGVKLSRAEMKKLMAGGKESRSASHHGSLRGPLPPADVYRRLSRRESEIFNKMVQGKTNREIAAELHISKYTVETHITNIGAALGITGRGALRGWISTQFR